MRSGQGRAKHQTSCGVALWQWLINSAATTAADTFSPSPYSVATSLAAGAGPAVGSLLPTQVIKPQRPQRLQVATKKLSGQAGWNWATDLLIRSTSILTSLSPSSALSLDGLSGARSSINGVMGGGKQVMVSPRGNSLCIPLSLPSSCLNERISPCRASSPGRHLTSASPTPLLPLCRLLKASPVHRLPGFWALVAFPGIPVMPSFKTGPPSSNTATPFSLGARRVDSHHLSPCPSAWPLLSDRKWS